jgi:hypothetical protein
MEKSGLFNQTVESIAIWNGSFNKIISINIKVYF